VSENGEYPEIALFMGKTWEHDDETIFTRGIRDPPCSNKTIVGSLFTVLEMETNSV
jgi:hypothetical protein